MPAGEDRIDAMIQLKPVEDDEEGGEVQRAGIDVRVVDEDQSQFADEATITVTSDDGSYDEQKSGQSMGMATSFEAVPLPAVIRAEAPEYQPGKMRVDAGDMGKSV